MARNMYGATSADFTLTSGGRVIPGAVLTLWSARTGGTQITDLLDVDSVACTTVTSAADGSVVYYGPNNDKDTHWAQASQGSRIAIRPVNITGDASTGIFSVLDYGATGDGVTDDTAAIQAAITAAIAVAGTVLIPPGTYKISDALAVTGAVTITGTGTIHQVTAAKHGLTVTGDDVTVEGITLTGRHTSAVCADGENAVHAFGPSAAAAISNLTFRDLTISGWGDYGVQLKWVTDYTVTGCTITDVGYAGVSTLSAIRGLIADNRIDTIAPGFSGDCYGIALSRDEVDSLTTDPHSSDAIVRGNVVSNITWEGLDTHDGQRIAFVDNVILNCGRGIMVGGGDAAGQVPTWGPKDVIVSGNVIDSQRTDGTASPGIAFTGIPGATADVPAVDYGTGAIVGNVIRGHGIQDSTEGAIYCRNTEGLVISGNTIEQPSAYGICMYYDNRGFSITSNVIVDVWSTANSSPSAIRFLSSNNTGLVAGNVLRDGAKTATYVNVNGIRAHATTVVNYGLNEFTAATYPLYDLAGVSTKMILPLLLSSGTETVPGLAFTGDVDTGLWLRAAGQLAFCVAGERQAQFYDGGLELMDGVAIDVGTSAGTYFGVAANRKIGFWGATPKVQQIVAGARNNPEGALKDLLTKLANIGIISDTTTAS